MVAVQHLYPVPRHSNKLQIPRAQADPQVSSLWYTPGSNLLVHGLHVYGHSVHHCPEAERYRWVRNPVYDIPASAC
jgi:hypothetical protein